MRRIGWLAPTLIALAFVSGAAGDVPAARSAMPTEDEWKKDGAEQPMRWKLGCTTKRLREWVRVSCPGEPVRSAVIAGARDDVQFGRGWVVFPLRKGERRVIQLWLGDASHDTPYVPAKGEVRLISSYWLEGQAEPTITLQ